MTFDFAKTLSLVKGGLLDHQATWAAYLEENPGWQQTAVVLTGPLILANVVLSIILSRMIGGFAYLGYYSNVFAALFWGLVMAALGFTIAVFVFNFLAGVFKGKSNFSRAFAAVSLAAIPAWIAGVLAALIPFVGFLIALAGGIMSLVFMYRIMPLALGVPDDKRIVHFIASLVVIVILNFIIGSFVGAGAMGSAVQRSVFSDGDTTARSVTGSGIFGEIERQGRLMEAATADVYNPPEDGELTEAQVREYIKVLKKTRSIHEDYAEKMQKLSDDMQAKEAAGEKATWADMTRMYSGIGTVVGASNAEMEVVKTGKGNWAEHTWVKQQLRTARIQQGDESDATAHNYELYEKYEEDLMVNY
ncbi:MAG: YIP1 family protein [Proteobacteria bacterium]|nr:YIP1 family protein [Pseudomonadota bacterium]